MDSPVPLMHHDSDSSWITDPDPDHRQGTQPNTTLGTVLLTYFYLCFKEIFKLQYRLFLQCLCGFVSFFFSHVLV